MTLSTRRFRFNSTQLKTQIIEPTQMPTNMIYDAAPRLTEADQPLIVIETEPEELGDGGRKSPG